MCVCACICVHVFLCMHAKWQLPKDCTREHWFKAGYCDLPNLVMRTRRHIWSWLLNPFFSRYKVHNRFSPNCSCNCKLQINCKSSSLSSGSSDKCLSFEITTVSYFPIHINAPFFLGTHSNPDVYYKICVCVLMTWMVYPVSDWLKHSLS